MLDFQILFSSKFMQDRAMPIRRRTSPLLPPEERSRSFYQRRRPLQPVHLPPGLLSKAWMGEPRVFWFSTSLSEDQRPSGSCSGERGNVLGVGNYCYFAVCSAALGASAPTEGGEGRGISWRPPAYRLFCLLAKPLLKNSVDGNLQNTSPDSHVV